VSVVKGPWLAVNVETEKAIASVRQLCDALESWFARDAYRTAARGRRIALKKGTTAEVLTRRERRAEDVATIHAGDRSLLVLRLARRAAKTTHPLKGEDVIDTVRAFVARNLDKAATARRFHAVNKAAGLTLGEKRDRLPELHAAFIRQCRHLRTHPAFKLPK
jgi:hypothetical protein